MPFPFLSRVELLLLTMAFFLGSLSLALYSELFEGLTVVLGLICLIAGCVFLVAVVVRMVKESKKAE